MATGSRTSLRGMSSDCRGGNYINLHDQQETARLERAESQSLPSDNEPLSPNTESNNQVPIMQHPNADWIKIFNFLSLSEHYPQKITLIDVMERCDEPSDTPDNLAWIILKKLIMLDRRAVLDAFKQESVGENEDSFFDEADSSENAEINPLDAFLAIFMCCDLNLRQVLIEKMQLCHLSFPFLIPKCPDRNAFELGLWALRGMKLTWRNKGGTLIEANPVSHNIPVVTNLRIDNPMLSKSKVLGKLIDKRVHDTFINEESPNGKAQKGISGGLVEGTYYLPSGRDDGLQGATLFLNLRGDGLKHAEQIQVLQKISNVFVVFLHISALTEQAVKQAMKKVHKASPNMILVLSKKDTSLSPNDMRLVYNNYKAFIGQEFKMIGYKGDDEELVKNLIKEIKKSLDDKTGVKLEGEYDEMQQMGVWIDEMDGYCQQGKEYARRVMSHLGQEERLSKKNLLPCQEHWKKWSDMLRKKTRSHKNTVEQNEAFKKDMTEIRNEQNKATVQPSGFVQDFLTGLRSLIEQPSILFYLQWLKVFLGERVKADKLPLFTQQETVSNRAKQQKAEAKDTKSLEDEVQTLEQDIQDTNMSLEHLMREMAQMYEASTEQAGEGEHSLEDLPYIAAKLVLFGFPLEIMDGDANGVPKIWLDAVFEKLAEEVKKKKEQKEIDSEDIFTLSVLGVQSSGKSTLMNTMFGLQLPTSAGRCTVGVYMQFIKVNGYPFNYVAILDTEGLKGTESERDRDNELATFVIGLGNTTLMNLKGENVEDAKDTLLVATHAFLRIGMVNKDILRDRSCVFVHQNVAAVDAPEQLKKQSEEMEKSLDKLTAEAAKLENCTQYERFNQIIQFDHVHDIKHFPDLWEVPPPMPSVTREYHMSVLALQKELLQSNKSELSDRQMFSIRGLGSLMANVWKGILSDDFIFTFRNSLMTAVYTHLQTKCSDLKWQMEDEYQSGKLKLQQQIRCCYTNDELHATSTELQADTTMKIEKMKQDIIEELEVFINRDSQRDLMKKWKNDRISGFKNTTETLCEQAKLDIQEMEKKQELRIWMSEKGKDLPNQLMAGASKLSKDFKSLSEKDLKKVFNQLWDTLSKGTEHLKNPGEATDASKAKTSGIEGSLLQVLYDTYPAHGTVVGEEHVSNPIQGQHGSKLELSVGKDDWVFEGLENGLRGWTIFKEKRLEEAKAHALHFVNASIFQNIDRHLTKVGQKKFGFQAHDAKEMLLILKEHIEKFNNDDKQMFTFPKSVEIKLAIYVCRYSLQTFHDAEDDYDNEYSVCALLEQYKISAWNIFQLHLLEEIDKAKLVTSMVCDQLKPIITTTVLQEVRQNILQKVQHNIPNKKVLIKMVLESLMKNDNYRAYKTYIDTAKMFTHTWVKEYVERLAFGKQQHSLFLELVRRRLEHYSKVLEENLVGINEKGQSLGTLMDALAKIIIKSNLAIHTTRTKNSIVDESNISDIKHFKHVFTTGIGKMVNTIYDEFKGRTTIDWPDGPPSEGFFNSLWGCEEECPLCKEPCTNGEKNHTDLHTCLQHRLVGCGHWGDGQEVIHITCNYAAASDTKFPCGSSFILHECDKSDAKNTLHNYSDFDIHFPTWDILPNEDDETSLYWKRFVGRFNKDIAKEKNLATMTPPNSWKSISKEKAIKSLSEKERPFRNKNKQGKSKSVFGRLWQWGTGSK